MYPTLCRSSFALMMCITVSGKPYLLADLQEPCYEGRHLQWFLMSTIPQILLYVIGLPVFAFIIIRKYAKKNRLKHQIVQFRYGMLYSGYRVDCWWWDIVVAFRKASVALITSWLVGALEIHATICMLTLSIVFNIWGNPYTDNIANDKANERGQKLLLLDASANCVTFLTAWSGLFFVLYPHCEYNTIWCTLLVAGVVVLNGLFLYIVFMFFLQRNMMKVNSM